MTDVSRPELAEQAARAAREAADEARDPEARFFLRRHADRLARMAAAERLAARAAAHRAGLAAPLVELLPA